MIHQDQELKTTIKIFKKEVEIQVALDEVFELIKSKKFSDASSIIKKIIAVQPRNTDAHIAEFLCFFKLTSLDQMKENVALYSDYRRSKYFLEIMTYPETEYSKHFYECIEYLKDQLPELDKKPFDPWCLITLLISILITVLLGYFVVYDYLYEQLVVKYKLYSEQNDFIDHVFYSCMVVFSIVDYLIFNIEVLYKDFKRKLDIKKSKQDLLSKILIIYSGKKYRAEEALKIAFEFIYQKKYNDAKKIIKQILNAQPFHTDACVAEFLIHFKLTNIENIVPQNKYYYRFYSSDYYTKIKECEVTELSKQLDFYMEEAKVRWPWLQSNLKYASYSKRTSSFGSFSFIVATLVIIVFHDFFNSIIISDIYKKADIQIDDLILSILNLPYLMFFWFILVLLIVISIEICCFAYKFLLNYIIKIIRKAK
jgi:hypothetical protein